VADLPEDAVAALAQRAALRRIYGRTQPPVPWRDGENLPWDDATFSERMLAQHLDQSHGAASRPLHEIRAQVQQMRAWLELSEGDRLLDITCGPGLYASEFAGQGIDVTGVDFGPASIAHARKLSASSPRPFTLCEADVREMDLAGQAFDAAIYIYGQFTVLRPAEAADVLRRIRAALRPRARLLLEVLDYDHFDKQSSNWWYTDQGGLWGDFPYLHLGERAWDPEQSAAVERFFILNLDSGEMQDYGLSDQAYTEGQMREMLNAAGFELVAVHPAWAGLALKDAEEWVVYVAEAT